MQRMSQTNVSLLLLLSSYLTFALTFIYYRHLHIATAHFAHDTSYWLTKFSMLRLSSVWWW